MTRDLHQTNCMRQCNLLRKKWVTYDCELLNSKYNHLFIFYQNVEIIEYKSTIYRYTVKLNILLSISYTMEVKTKIFLQ